MPSLFFKFWWHEWGRVSIKNLLFLVSFMVPSLQARLFWRFTEKSEAANNLVVVSGCTVKSLHFCNLCWFKCHVNVSDDVSMFYWPKTLTKSHGTAFALTLTDSGCSYRETQAQLTLDRGCLYSMERHHTWNYLYNVWPASGGELNNVCHNLLYLKWFSTRLHILTPTVINNRKKKLDCFGKMRRAEPTRANRPRQRDKRQRTISLVNVRHDCSCLPSTVLSEGENGIRFFTVFLWIWIFHWTRTAH